MLKDLFEKCIADVDGDKIRGARRFLLAAKQENPNVTMEECMKISGYTDDDERKNANLAQSFRSKIFNPIRDHVAKVKFGVPDVSKLFGRTGEKRSKEDRELRNKILGVFPSQPKRGVTAAKEDNMEYIDDLLN